MRLNCAHLVLWAYCSIASTFTLNQLNQRQFLLIACSVAFERCSVASN